MNVRAKFWMLGGLMSALTLLGGCGEGWSLFSDDSRQWSEEVLLADGTTIVVKRAVKFKEANALGGGAYSLQVKSSTLAFTGELAALPAWSALLDPLVLYRDATQGEQWVIVAATTECEVWNQRGGPQPPYWEFRLRENGWQEVPLSPTSIDQPANLLLNYQRLKDSQVTPVLSQDMDRESSERYRFVRAQAKSKCARSSRDPYGLKKTSKK